MVENAWTHTIEICITELLIVMRVRFANRLEDTDEHPSKAKKFFTLEFGKTYRYSTFYHIFLLNEIFA